ncbi:LacI family DNA-binding transcriptional regulator [Domibacillus sp. 8LH]|uniref:LacI family DNA-binding transcriptional regulator n=1 Tax=Domibacillus sp. 8LH TaxID=3073900 RepID=UPI00317C8EA8
MKPTIYDVAEKAGVSIATVSKVVNNTGRISEKTRKRVTEIMRVLDYQPSSVAAALTGKKTYTVGVLVPDIANPFFAEVARALENRARESGYTLMLCSTDYKQQREREYLELFSKKQVDGVMVAIEPEEMDHFKKFNERGVPSVMLSVNHLDASASVVMTDNVRGGYLAGKYLLSKGHHELAIMYEKQRQSGRSRLIGFQQALSEVDVMVEEPYVIDTRSDILEAKKAAQKLLRLPKKPTAVFAATDLIAIVLINEARGAGVRVPEDMSVIGFDNTIYAEIADPGLTTIAQPITDLAHYSFDQLLQLIKQPDQIGHRIMLAPSLIERGSVRKIIDGGSSSNES